MFTEVFHKYNRKEVSELIASRTESDVHKALNTKGRGTMGDFAALISPAAHPMLEEMAALSHKRTIERFGRTIQMYIPVYLSNECQNICTYCGFSLDNPLKRTTLTDEQIIQEARAVKAMGYDHILLVTGEANRTVGVDYLVNAVRLVRPMFSNISIEVQPLEEEEYRRLQEEGVYAVLVYQETYHPEAYKTYHPKGRKSNFTYRLETPDRIGRAGMHKIGLGVLLGLDDWRVDSFYTALHLQYMERKYWRTRYSISFPRLRPFSGGHMPAYPMSDAELVQLICSYRIFNEEVELSLSTRESKVFRDHLIRLGITSTSAGSRTDPGGYTSVNAELEQFEIADDRPPEEVARAIRDQGYEVVWKDWEKSYS